MRVVFLLMVGAFRLHGDMHSHFALPAPCTAPPHVNAGNFPFGLDFGGKELPEQGD